MLLRHTTAYSQSLRGTLAYDRTVAAAVHSNDLSFVSRSVVPPVRGAELRDSPLRLNQSPPLLQHARASEEIVTRKASLARFPALYFILPTSTTLERGHTVHPSTSQSQSSLTS